MFVLAASRDDGITQDTVFGFGRFQVVRNEQTYCTEQREGWIKTNTLENPTHMTWGHERHLLSKQIHIQLFISSA